MYSAQVLDHFENPRNSGDLPEASARVRVENPVCGDILELAVKVEKGIIVAVRFRARGCVASVACASRLTEEMIGRSIEEAQEFRRETLLKALGGLPAGSDHASHLAMDALSQALDELPT